MAGGLALTLLLTAAGGCGMPLSWETREERIEITSDGVEALALKTHNGAIQVRAADEDEDDALIEVVATIKGGASSDEEVRACLDAIEIVVSEADSSTPEISWRWRDGHRSSWSATVSFEAVIPKRLGVAAETRNGAIDVNGVEGDCRMESQNGRIRTLASRTSLKAETHNGAIFAQTIADEIVLLSHNGSIDAVLANNDAINAKVETHNGSIELALNPLCSTKVSGHTKNGHITSTLPLEHQVSDRKSISGETGTGTGMVTVSTHNGSISLRATDTMSPANRQPPRGNTAETPND